MKFRCERDALSEAIGSAGHAVASRSGALPILSGLLVRTAADEIHLAGSDLELTIRVSAPAEIDQVASGDSVACWGVPALSAAVFPLLSSNFQLATSPAGALGSSVL